MSLARSFTKRFGRSDTLSAGNDAPARSFSQRKPIKPGQISLPVILLSSTNMLSYEAPDIASMQKVAQASIQEVSSAPSSSRPSSDDATPMLTDGSSVESSPTVEYNHLSCYFPGPTIKRSQSAKAIAKADSNVPALPSRAPSHSKREHERMARKRSVRSSSGSTAASHKSSPTTSVDPAFAAAAAAYIPDQESPASLASPPAAHAFSQELERLNEVAEEFVAVAGGWEAEDDALVMKQKGLQKVSAEEYISLVDSFRPSVVQGGWI
ncbi:MAG: hypothetical protein M1828_005401 [Chrysothrix sp. TS-e1954]|nr:MAG: hypothetical protein M1828_005401 [Chrysothrix sp. TS-e1954]